MAIIDAPADVNDLLAEQDEEYEWLIPGLLEVGDRLILTGGEGKGKSTFLRQLAVQTALGIHPFTLEPMQPRRVMVVDLENGRRNIKRKFREIIGEREVPKGQLLIASWPSGLDLSYDGNVESMSKVLADFWPELLVIGPTYKMSQHLEQEEASAHLAAVIDNWRTILGFTLAMESHQPHQAIVEGKRYRPERPFGSSLWLRWPEFGLCLEDAGNLRHWRGPREERDWPEKLRWGNEWPWVVDSKMCMVCEQPLAGQQDKYCSETCRNTGKQRDFRARQRLL